ncbi:uncharacterized protein B0I36DRAFT_394426 [Microdochium trichocladiopsis]|uniref:Uncharacterized protein n=1 Tax=Microdochium trichocladiopsis TaxID=1682393 RepID=A0A9P9BIJ7_9PEZI|nr:uncharacterized protein B0I36DRAFT_401800 [Microdochium trichocladiopsis]XP_046007856.1 uncharacterized protein B0I36DRAFT_394426 [Microdochium trichocladiopsis]KAH7009386.1 hypothetical protein B0I36DRAFT_401800 [Microdochium trichocladiopsis]KAH7021655.1 hypothetical protein B0I36DRAFT_394426 [Microdochium trichocladiopsis]
MYTSHGTRLLMGTDCLLDVACDSSIASPMIPQSGSKVSQRPTDILWIVHKDRHLSHYMGGESSEPTFLVQCVEAPTSNTPPQNCDRLLAGRFHLRTGISDNALSGLIEYQTIIQPRQEPVVEGGDNCTWALKQEPCKICRYRTTEGPSRPILPSLVIIPAELLDPVRLLKQKISAIFLEEALLISPVEEILGTAQAENLSPQLRGEAISGHDVAEYSYCVHGKTFRGDNPGQVVCLKELQHQAHTVRTTGLRPAPCRMRYLKERTIESMHEEVPAQ